MGDAAELLAPIVAAQIYAGIGECTMMLVSGAELFRSSLGCAHNYSRDFHFGRLQNVIDGQFCCQGCVFEDQHLNPEKLKGFITLSMVKAFVEVGFWSEADGIRSVLQMMKVHSKEELLA